MSQVTAKPQRGRVPTFVAALLLTAATCGGAGMIWWWMHRTHVSADVMVIEGGTHKRERHGGLVTKDKESAIRAVAGGMEVRLIPANGQKKAELQTRGLGMDNLITPQQEQVLRATRRVIGAAGVAKRMNVTPEQVQKLKQIPLDLELKVAEQDRARLQTLCVAWDKAQGEAKAAAETQLIAAMKEIGPKAMAATKQNLAQNIVLAKGTLTPQQWQQYEQWQVEKTTAKAVPAANKKEVKAAQPAPVAKKPTPEKA